jgi:hypothetical protein
MSNSQQHTLYPINELDESSENDISETDPLLINPRTRSVSTTLRNGDYPVLFRYVDRNDPTRIHTVIEVKPIPSGTYWVTEDGRELVGDTDNPAYQYYKMETEFLECYNNIFNTNPIVVVGNARIDSHKQERALAYIQNKSLNRIESHLYCMRVLYIFWSLVAVAMIITGIVIAVRHNMF